jgi:hypothetical protein
MKMMIGARTLETVMSLVKGTEMTPLGRLEEQLLMC